MSMQANNGRQLTRRQALGMAAAAPFVLTGSANAKSTSYSAPMLNLRQNGPVVLEFGGGEPEESGPGALVEAFNERDPSIQVRYTRYVNDDTGNTQLDTALQGGTTVDVVQMYGNPRLGPRIQANAVADISALINDEQEIIDWVEEEPEVVFGTEESIFALACVREPTVVFANQELLDNAGVTIPDAWTVDDFMSLAQDLSGEFAYGAFAPPDIARQLIGSNYWYKDDGVESNFDHPAFRESNEAHRSMIEAGSAFPWTDVLARNLRVYQQNLYLTGQLAFWPTAFWVMRYINDTEEYPHDFITTTLSLPAPEGADPLYNPGTTGNWITMSAASENQDAAWEFIKFRLDEGAQFYLEAGKQPAFPGTDEELVVNGLLGENAEERYDVETFEQVAFDPDVILTNDTITIAAGEIEQIEQQLTDRYLIGEIDIDECMSELKARADEVIIRASQ